MKVPRALQPRGVPPLIVLSFLAVILAPGALLADEEPPVYDRARELVAVINKKTPDVIEAFVTSAMTAQMRDAFPMELHVDALSSMHDRGAPWVRSINEDFAPFATTSPGQRSDKERYVNA